MPRRRALLAAAALLAGLALAGPAAGASLFTNTTSIAIPVKGTSTPYPSYIDVQGQNGVVTDVVAGLRGVTHPSPGDLDVLLTSPGGASTILMSDTCGAAPFANVSLTFTRNPLFPEMPSSCGSGGVFRPTDRRVIENDPEGWPGAGDGPFAADLDRLIGSSPNGPWALRIRDDLSPGSGTVARGWTLAVETAVPTLRVPAAPGSGIASRYPVDIPVTARLGVIEDVDVVVSGAYHARPDDLEIVLESPSGKHVALMTDACAGTRAVNASWHFDDEAPARMPARGACPDTAWKPTIAGPADLPAPAPKRPYGQFLSELDYRVPNGDWRVWVNDDTPGDADGFTVGDVSLLIETRFKAQALFVGDPLTLREGESGVIRLGRSSGGRGLGPATATLLVTPVGATPGADLSPIPVSVPFEESQTTAEVPVAALADDLPEDTEALGVAVVGGSGDLEPGPAASTVVSITDTTPSRAGGAAAGGGTATGGTTAGGADADRAAPRIAGLRLARRVASARRGTTLRYALSEQAATTLTVERRTRIGRRTRFVAVGTLAPGTAAGPHAVPLRRRVGRAVLRPGLYRVVVTAIDTAGNRAQARSRTFRITR